MSEEKNHSKSTESFEKSTRSVSTETKRVESGTEFITKRDQTVWNTAGGTIASDGTTGNKKIQITSEGGGNINLNSKVNSEFAPNNKQTLVHGNQYTTTAGDNFENVKSNKEQRVEGDLTIITGSENFFTQPIAEEWIDKNKEIAAAKAAPEYNYGAVGNNTETEYADGGTAGEGGAVEGGSYKQSDAHADIPALMESKAADIAATEAKMGAGGNIKMMSAKHLSLMAGTKAVTFDSGVMVPNARKVVKQYEVDGGKCKPVYTAVSTYESKDTAGSVPFGDVHISAASKFRLVTGAGGVSIKSAGEVNINSTGRLMAGGSEVAIAGSNKSNTGRVTMISDTDMFQEAGVIATRVAPNINDVASTQHSFHTPKGVFTGDLHIKGNVTVEGPDGIRVPAGDVIAGSVSLKNHTHSGVCAGSETSGPPNGSASGGDSGGGGTPGGLVNKIIAGNNVTISPSNGKGDVTINATASSDFSGSYNDLTDVPTTFNTISSFSGSYADLSDIPTTFNTVSSFSGSYNDLTDQPTIPTNNTELTNGCGFTTCLGDITEVTTNGDYLTGGGLTGAINIGLDAGCAQKWDNASAGSVVAVTAVAPLSSTNGTSPGISLDAACVTNWNTAYTDSQNTKTCAGLDCEGTITAVCGEHLLSGFASSGFATIGVRSGALEYLNQSTCPGIDCIGTLVASDISGLTDCLGTVTCVSTGPYLTGGVSTLGEIGLDSACAAKWDSTAAGGILGVTATGGLSGGGASGCVSVALDSSMVTLLNQSACTGLDCIGTVEGVTTSTLLSGGGTSGCFNIGIDSGALAYLDQSSCTGLNKVGTVTGSTAGALLSTNNNSTCLEFGINSGALDYLNQSACAGIDKIGTVEGVTTSTLLSGGGTSGCFNIGINSGALTYLDQSSCPGINCLGTVTCVTTGPYLTGGFSTLGEIGIDSACASKWDTAATGGVQSLTVGGGIVDAGTSTDPNICIDAACNTKWDQSGCTGLNKVGTVTGSTAGPLLSTNNNSTCIQFGIDSGALTYLDQSSCLGLDCVGTVTCVTGGVGIDHTAGPNPELSVDNTVVRTIGNQVVGGTKHFTSPTNFLSVSATGLITGECITTGAFMESNAASPEVYPQGTVLSLNTGGCVVESTEANSTMVFGVATGDSKAPIVMGAEPICITGDIKIGDYITTSNKEGHGMKSTNPFPFGTIIAQAMEAGCGDSFEIKAMIRKM